MKFAKLFSKLALRHGPSTPIFTDGATKNSKDSDQCTLEEGDPTSTSERSDRKAEKKHRKDRKHKHGKDRTSTDDQKQAKDLVLAFLEAHNQEKRASCDEMMNFFKDDTVRVHFEDGNSVTAAQYATECENAFRSFPDFTFSYGSVNPKPTTQLHSSTNKQSQVMTVVVEDQMISGTHTGAPYGFGPFPPVSTTNKKVVNGPERIFYTIENGKIVKLEVISLGDANGPAGFYSQIGGDLSMPPPPQADPASGSALE